MHEDDAVGGRENAVASVVAFREPNHGLRLREPLGLGDEVVAEIEKVGSRGTGVEAEALAGAEVEAGERSTPVPIGGDDINTLGELVLAGGPGCETDRSEE